MVKKWLKYARKSRYKKQIWTFLVALEEGNIDQYDIKKMKWLDDHYRVRLWDIRIIFKVKNTVATIIKIQERWDIY